MIAVIDYGSGNLRSVAKALEHVAGGRSVEVVRLPEALKDARHIVLPGVGAFGDCMRGLTVLPGMIAALEEEVLHRQKPLLGICVGMQMLFEEGREHGSHLGLGWLKGAVAPLNVPLKVPHMGWNDLSIVRDHPVMRDIPAGADVYFVHSYHAVCSDKTDVIATVEYGQAIAAAVGRENILGTQFHPEKSQAVGLALLKNFVNL